jgi:hypothetical protein
VVLRDRTLDGSANADERESHFGVIASFRQTAFSPEEMRQIITPTPHGAHMIDYELARALLRVAALLAFCRSGSKLDRRTHEVFPEVYGDHANGRHHTHGRNLALTRFDRQPRLPSFIGDKFGPV